MTYRLLEHLKGDLVFWGVWHLWLVLVVVLFVILFIVMVMIVFSVVVVQISFLVINVGCIVLGILVTFRLGQVTS